MEFNKFHYTI